MRGAMRSQVRQRILSLLPRYPRAAVVVLWSAHALTLLPIAVLAGWLLHAAGHLEWGLGVGLGICALIFLAAALVLSPLEKLPAAGELMLGSAVAVGVATWAVVPGESLFTAITAGLYVLLCLGPGVRVAEAMPWMIFTKAQQTSYFQRVFPSVDDAVFYPWGELHETVLSAALASLEAQGLRLSPTWRAIAEKQMGVLGCLAAGWLTHAPGRALDARERLDRALPAAVANVARRPRL